MKFSIGCPCLILSLFLVSCKHTQEVPTPPPLPARTGAPKSVGAILPPPTKTLTISWHQPQPESVASWNVYHNTRSPSLSGMVLLTNVTQTNFQFVVNKSVPMEFFSVKAVGIFGNESDWATK